MHIKIAAVLCLGFTLCIASEQYGAQSIPLPSAPPSIEETNAKETTATPQSKLVLALEQRVRSQHTQSSSSLPDLYPSIKTSQQFNATSPRLDSEQPFQAYISFFTHIQSSIALYFDLIPFTTELMNILFEAKNALDSINTDVLLKQITILFIEKLQFTTIPIKGAKDSKTKKTLQDYVQTRELKTLLIAIVENFFTPPANLPINFISNYLAGNYEDLENLPEDRRRAFLNSAWTIHYLTKLANLINFDAINHEFGSGPFNLRRSIDKTIAYHLSKLKSTEASEQVDINECINLQKVANFLNATFKIPLDHYCDLDKLGELIDFILEGHPFDKALLLDCFHFERLLANYNCEPEIIETMNQCIRGIISLLSDFIRNDEAKWQKIFECLALYTQKEKERALLDVGKSKFLVTGDAIVIDAQLPPATLASLGRTYYEGLGVNIDYRLAFAYFRQLASEKILDREAQALAYYYMGEIARLGREQPVNMKAAQTYLEYAHNTFVGSQDTQLLRYPELPILIKRSLDALYFKIGKEHLNNQDYQEASVYLAKLEQSDDPFMRPELDLYQGMALFLYGKYEESCGLLGKAAAQSANPWASKEGQKYLDQATKMKQKNI